MICNIDKELLDGLNVVEWRDFPSGPRPVVYFDPQSEPVEINGLPFNRENRTLCKFPEDHLRDMPINKGVSRCGAHRLAGVYFRFRTNSALIGIRAVIGHHNKCLDMPIEASSGFSVYEGQWPDMHQTFTVGPKTDTDTFFEGWQGEPGYTEWRDVAIYCPLLTEVPYVRIILTHDADIGSPTPFRHPRPVAFYGSSITNGVGASDASMDYPSRIGRELDMATVNLGFNGSCHGEPMVADFISRIPDLAAFVMGYDQNAKTPAELIERHEVFFRRVRAACPELPIILYSRPNERPSENTTACRAVVEATYRHAVADGDRLVWYIDGNETFPNNDVETYTISDNIHPNDEGYRCIMDRIIPVLKEALGI